jgi:hypothetical protein
VQRVGSAARDSLHLRRATGLLMAVPCRAGLLSRRRGSDPAPGGRSVSPSIALAAPNAQQARATKGASALLICRFVALLLCCSAALAQGSPPDMSAPPPPFADTLCDNPC